MGADVKTLKMGEGGKPSRLQKALSLHSAAPTAASSLLQGLKAQPSPAAQYVRGEKQQIDSCPAWLCVIHSPVAERHLGYFSAAWNMALPLQRKTRMFN